MKKLLLLHGNGGGRTRFLPFLTLHEQQQAEFEIILPELPGFDGRPLPGKQPSWGPFIAALQRAVASDPKAEWVFYGHGIGGSLLLEWASQGWNMPENRVVQPEKVLLHGIIGASLEHRFFPKLMRPMPVRQLMQRLIAWPTMRPVWEKRLFQQPGVIPLDIRKQFFRDYARCAAFPVFFDLITPDWYRRVQQQLSELPFEFIWGEEERVVASRYLTYWKRDFPSAHFDIVPGWDHFPMLDAPEAFYHYLTQKVEA
ncbi:MAG: alpha/beta fold hydrolase [Bacteroidetes bacterium]|jgi:pimeloyl-ACP methyl ester carboxylesterase|nr:alpha/beta fold hydrolase [Bacteroidota bacterium]